MVIFSLVSFFLRQSVQRRLVLLENMVPVMVPLCVKWSRKWKSPSTPNIHAVSVERYASHLTVMVVTDLAVLS